MDNESIQERLIDSADLISDIVEGVQTTGIVSSAIRSKATQISNFTSSLDAYYAQLKKVRNNSIANALYDILEKDILLSSASELMINISSDDTEDKDNKYVDEIRSMFDRFDVAGILTGNLADILHYGSYPIKVRSEDGVGITDLVDLYSPGEVIPIVDIAGNPILYAVNRRGMWAPTKGMKTTVEFKSIAEVVNLTYTNKYIKIASPAAATKTNAQSNLLYSSYLSMLGHNGALSEEDIEGTIIELLGSSKIKVAESYIFDVINDLAALESDREIKTLHQLAELLKPNLVSLSIPDMTNPADSIELVKKYEGLINSNLTKFSAGFTTSGSVSDRLRHIVSNLDVADIAGVHCIPVTSSNRGDISPVNLRSDHAALEGADKYDDMIRNVLSVKGVPNSLFFDDAPSRMDAMKNARYSKTVKTAQRQIAKSLKFLALLHLSRKFPNEVIDESQISISLASSTNYDVLHNLEAVDLTISSIDNVMGLLERLHEITDGSDYRIDNSELLGSIRESLRQIGTSYSSAIVKDDTGADAASAGDDEATQTTTQETNTYD